MINSYAKVWAIGHAAVGELFLDPVIVEEKADGSQFSMAVINGELHCRSKGCALIIDAPDKMFAKAVETAKELAPLMRDGWVYRGEYLQKPKHNALAYDRVPAKHVAIFDICPSLETYLPPAEKAEEAARLGLEAVPTLYTGMVDSPAELLSFLERASFLGGQKIEGVVAKCYTRFGPDKKVLLGKYVSEAFKEVHRNDWKKENPSSKDILERIADQYRSKARWQKAVQHLRERGELEGSPRDIGKLMIEAQRDIEEECADDIKQQFWEWSHKEIMRRSVRGLPQWYKEELLRQQFEREEPTT